MASGLSFSLNGALCSALPATARQTLLSYLRDQRGLRGTKEGCAEGDCGACMVAVDDPEGGGYRPVNACICLLGSLHGRAVITVEGLRPSEPGTLHPVQQALLEANASQCGFCTPGFVMSLFCLFSANRNASPDDIRYALAGNLCRCTGYRPILQAALDLQTSFPGLLDGDHAAGVRPPDGAELEAAGFRSPRTLAELEADLRRSPGAALLAGGTDLVPAALAGHAPLPEVVYLGRVAELRVLELSGDQLLIGAAAPLREVFRMLQREFPQLKEFLRRFASPSIVSSGTLGGNLATGSPVGDCIPLLIALNASLRLRRAGGSRVLALEDFYTGYRSHALQPGEFIATVQVPRAVGDAHLRAYKVARRFEQDISTVVGVFHLAMEDECVTAARICYGGMSDRPRRALGAEAALLGRELDDAALDDALRALDEDYQPIGDVRGSAAYRRQAARNLLVKLRADLTERERVSLWEMPR